uniref:Uncharacterized protein n=1 Tax=Magallana gigas TaxID=29159 RepID=K1QCV2_MAGGI
MGARTQVVFYGVLFLSLFVFIHGFSKEVVTPVGNGRVKKTLYVDEETPTLSLNGLRQIEGTGGRRERRESVKKGRDIFHEPRSGDLLDIKSKVDVAKSKNHAGEALDSHRYTHLQKVVRGMESEYGSNAVHLKV